MFESSSCSSMFDSSSYWSSAIVMSELLPQDASGDDDLHVVVRSERPSSAPVLSIPYFEVILRIETVSLRHKGYICLAGLHEAATMRLPWLLFLW
jgi:hypothetical protein